MSSPTHTEFNQNYYSQRVDNGTHAESMYQWTLLFFIICVAISDLSNFFRRAGMNEKSVFTHVV